MDDDEMELFMPFIVTTDNGGTYEPSAFVAGCYFGEIQTRVNAEEETIEKYVPTQLVPQIDLLAMATGYLFAAEAWDEHPDEWTLIQLLKDTSDG